MNQVEFRMVIADTLVPMLQGRLSDDVLSSTTRQQLASYVVNANRLAVKPAANSGYRLVISRSQVFTDLERQLAGQFMEELASAIAVDAGPFQPELIRAVPRRVVATHLGGGDLLRNVLEQLETWSSQTYEGQRIVAAIGLDQAPGASGIAVQQLWEQPFGPVLTNGFDTLLSVGSDGEISGLLQLSSNDSSRTAPYRLREVACWAIDGRVSVVLNLHGEILVFKDQSLRFARRGGNWLHYVHQTNIDRMYPPRSRVLRMAVYESCLDVSFARTGGCIGLLDQVNVAQLGNYVAADDLLSAQATYKSQVLARVINGTRFQSLDRRARIELLSLDGAMVLDNSGRILCAGTIINVEGGGVGGGGRTAAAMRLSELGLGIKVSQDGSIRAYRGSAETFKT